MMERDFEMGVLQRLTRIETKLEDIEKRLDKPQNGQRWVNGLVEVIRVLVAGLLAMIGVRVMRT